MGPRTRAFLAVLTAGLWVNASEFLRNEVLVKQYWTAHYRSLGLEFPGDPVNGILWVVWGFLFAAALYLVSRRFNLLQTTLIGWLTGFVMMWVILWNLSVLPLALLPYAIPLSLLEAFVGSYICRKIAPLV